MHVHLVVPDLFLPHEVAAEACTGLRLPALEKMLARAQAEPLSIASLEDWLCTLFGLENQAVAPVALQADGGHPGSAYWLQSVPVHLVSGNDRFVLRPVTSSMEEAAQLCASLNDHFAPDGLYFVVPHPQRWYLRLESAPAITTFSLAQATGRDMREHLPRGTDALHWHKLLNEIQMLLFQHPVNREREKRDEPVINSVYLWGGGYAPQTLLRPFDQVYTDNPLTAAFAKAAGINCASFPEDAMQCFADGEGNTLIVWDGLHRTVLQDDLGAWRDALQQLEQNCISPLLQSMRDKRIGKITLDVIQEQGPGRFTLKRARLRRFWHFPRPLDSYSPV